MLDATAMSRVADSWTIPLFYPAGDGGGVLGNFAFLMHSMPSNYAASPSGVSGMGMASLTTIAPTGPAAGSSGTITGFPSGLFDYKPGDSCAYYFRDNFAGSAVDPGIRDHYGGGNIWTRDFGDANTAWNSLAARYRCLAMALRLRVIGLPSGIFNAPGNVYFGQIPYDRMSLVRTEADCQKLMSLGQMTSVSLNQIAADGGKTWFMTHSTDQNLHMISSSYPAPGMQSITTLAGSSSSPTFNYRFPNVAGAYAQAYPGDPAAAVIPWTRGTPYAQSGVVPGPSGAGAFWNSGSDPAIFNPEYELLANNTRVIGMWVFGGANGVVLSVQRSKVFEWVPRPEAASVVETAVQVPDSAAMDRYMVGTAMLTGIRPALLQTDKDTAVDTVVGERMSAKILPEISRLTRGPGPLIAGRKLGYGEGFLSSIADWLGFETHGGITWDSKKDRSGKGKK